MTIVGGTIELSASSALIQLELAVFYFWLDAHDTPHSRFEISKLLFTKRRAESIVHDLMSV